MEKIKIYSILGIEINIVPENFGIIDYSDKFYAITGEFFYKTFLVDGKLIATEIQANEILQKINVKINKIIDNEIYFSNLENLNTAEINVEYISTEIIEDDEQEIFRII